MEPGSLYIVDALQIAISDPVTELLYFTGSETGHSILSARPRDVILLLTGQCRGERAFALVYQRAQSNRKAMPSLTMRPAVGSAK
jgi:hypothetical protein